MKKAKRELPLVYLHPGECRFSESPEIITTVLGSCVSVTMYVKRLKLGAMFHAIMPDDPQENSKEVIKKVTDDHKICRYVDQSIHMMLKKFESCNILKKEIEIKVFGGADLFTEKNNDDKLVPIGTQNIKSALKTLQNQNLTIQASDLGGNKGRKLFFFTDTGEIYLKRLGKVKKSDLLKN